MCRGTSFEQGFAGNVLYFVYENIHENKKGCDPWPDSNPSTKVDGSSEAILPSAVKTSITNENNQIAAVDEELTGFSVKRKKRRYVHKN